MLYLLIYEMLTDKLIANFTISVRQYNPEVTALETPNPLILSFLLYSDILMFI